jgi:hypothetical protein
MRDHETSTCYIDLQSTSFRYEITRAGASWIPLANAVSVVKFFASANDFFLATWTVPLANKLTYLMSWKSTENDEVTEQFK